MGTTCVRCAQPLGEPAGPAFCPACRARLRALLAARAGVRHASERSKLWPVAVVSLIALMSVVALLRQFGSAAAVEPLQAQHGIWQVLGDARFISPVGMA